MGLLLLMLMLLLQPSRSLAQVLLVLVLVVVVVVLLARLLASEQIALQLQARSRQGHLPREHWASVASYRSLTKYTSTPGRGSTTKTYERCMRSLKPNMKPECLCTSHLFHGTPIYISTQ
mmetsp:Transcript_11533/g.15954  ORF Transcript_11533/g.15954 Transcript_11533/m.15954 type:complete len:120 (-) Transcript_11533:87-446(-)